MYLSRLLKLLADALTMKTSEPDSKSKVTDSERKTTHPDSLHTSGFPLELILLWINCVFKTHATTIRSLLSTTLSHAARFSANQSNLMSLDTLAPSATQTTSSSLAILPHLIAIQTALRCLYSPLAKVTLQNIRLLDITFNQH